MDEKKNSHCEELHLLCTTLDSPVRIQSLAYASTLTAIRKCEHQPRTHGFFLFGRNRLSMAAALAPAGSGSSCRPCSSRIARLRRKPKRPGARSRAQSADPGLHVGVRAARAASPRSAPGSQEAPRCAEDVASRNWAPHARRGFRGAVCVAVREKPSPHAVFDCSTLNSHSGR